MKLFHLLVRQCPRGPQGHQHTQEPQHVYPGISQYVLYETGGPGGHI